MISAASAFFLSDSGTATPAPEASCTADTHDIFGDSSCVATYNLNGDATDLGGTYNGTATGVTYATGRFGQAAIFDGTTDNINTGYKLPTGLTTFTTSLWVKSTSLATNLRLLFGDFGTGADVGISFAVGFDGTNLQAWVGNGSVSIHDLYPVSKINDGAWHHLAFTISGTSLKAYINGIIEANITTTYGLNGRNTNNFLIGSDNASGWGCVTTDIDQFRIFNLALTEAEVRQLYAENAPFTDKVDTHDIFGDSSALATYQLNNDATDLGGTYNGTPTNITYTDGRFGQCAVFNGSSSSIDTTYTAVASSTVTFSTFVSTTTNVGTKAILWDGTGSTATTRGAFGFEGTAFAIFIGNGVSGWFDNSTVNVSAYQDGNSHHIGVVINGTSVKLYIDGVLLHTYTSTVSLGTAGSTPYYLGKLGTSASGYFNGKIDQTRIFNRALTHEEVLELYNERALTYTADTHDVFGDSSAVATYQFDNDATDLGGAHNGTPTNVIYGTGRFGQCFDGDGSARKIDISAPVPTNHTISAWINKDGAVASTASAGVLAYSSAVGHGIYYQQSTDKLLWLNSAESAYEEQSLAGYSGWIHVSFVYTGATTLDLYINGIKIKSGTVKAETVTYSHIGVRNWLTNWYYYTGDVDQVRIFNRILTECEIRTLYTETKPA